VLPPPPSPRPEKESSGINEKAQFRIGESGRIVYAVFGGKAVQLDGRQEAPFRGALRSEAGRTVWGWTLCLNALLGDLTLSPLGQEGAMKQG